MWRKDNILADDGFLAFALSEASDFYSELKRPDNEPQLSAKIDVEFFELDRQMEEDADLGSRYVMNPIDYQNIYRNGLIYLNMSDSGDDSKAYYGLKLTNRTGLGLYVNVYMFMNADLSIGGRFLYTLSSSSHHGFLFCFVFCLVHSSSREN